MESRPILTKKLNLLQEQMELKLAEIRESFSHHGIRGTHAEVVVREFIKQFLPPFNRIGHGEVVDSFGGCSKQVDVVIANEHHPYLNDLAAPSVYFIEGVACAGEVKSVLTTHHLTLAIENCRAFKNLRMNLPPKTTVTAPRSDAERFVPKRPYFLFAFESQLSFENVFQVLRGTYLDSGVPIPEQLDCVVLLDKGAIVNLGDGQGAMTAWNSTGQKIAGFAPFGRGGDYGLLLTFLFWLSVSNLRLSMPAPIMIPYIMAKNEDPA